jgi:hypothetical protein
VPYITPASIELLCPVAMRRRDGARVLGGAAFGTVLGYLAFRHSVPWTVREMLVLALGVAMVTALAIAVTLRAR